MTRSLVAALSAVFVLAGCGDSTPPPEPGLILVAEGGGTTEMGGQSAVRVSLAMAPGSPVAVDVLSGDSTEGAIIDAGSGQPTAWTTLHFTPADWSVSQVVSVAGVDDDARDGDVSWPVIFSVAPGSDANYAPLAAKVVTLTNADDDTPGVRLSRTSLATWETGPSTDTFTVALASRPAGAVTMPVVSAVPAEVRLRSDSSPTVLRSQVDLVFTPSNWRVAQAVTAVAQDDAVEDGDRIVPLAVGPAVGDAEYSALAGLEISVEVRDDDGPGAFHFSEGSGGYLSEGYSTRVCIAFLGVPAADVVIPFVGSHPDVLLYTSDQVAPATTRTELIVPAGSSPASGCVWVFAPADLAITGAVPFSVEAGPTVSADAAFDGRPAQQALMIRWDQEIASVSVLTDQWIVVSEAGWMETLRVRLSARPAADVVVPFRTAGVLLSVDGGTPAAPLDVVFTPDDWSRERQVTILAIDDTLFQPGADRPFWVIVGPTASADFDFDGLEVPLDDGTNYDNVLDGVIVDDEVGLPEGTVTAPLDLTGLLPWRGMVDGTASYYRVTGLPGALVSLRWPSSDLHASIYADASFSAGFLCSVVAREWAAGECFTQVSPSGEVFIRVDGNAVAEGAAFSLDVTPYHVAGGVPRILRRYDPDGETSSMAVAGAPESLAEISVYVDIDFWSCATAEIISPAGTRVLLSDQTYYDVDPQVFRNWSPSAPLAALVGEDANGTWSLQIHYPCVADGLLREWGIWVR